jgi:VWFA-related protein
VTRRPWPLAAAAALSLAALLAPAAPRAIAQRFSGDSANVVAIEVPVEVIKNGEPVRGLKAADFEVSEGRKKLKITNFDVVDLGATPAPSAAAPAPLPIAARRHFLFLFDLTFSEPRSVLKAREAAADLVTKSLHPSDLVAVATYSATKGPQLVLGFTADRRQIASAIDTLGVVQPLERSQTADPLKLVYAAELETAQNSRLSPSKGAVGAQARDSIEGELLDTLKSLSEATVRQDRQNEANRVIALSRSLADLARMMGNVEGRKYVVYLSEGFDSSLLTGTTDAQEVQQNNLTAETTPWAVSNEGRTGDTRTMDRVEKMFDAFRRADCVIQAVDIGGLRGSGDLGFVRPNGKDALFNMAKSTGGELYENWNDLGGAMGAMLRRTSVTYVLTLQPEDLKLDGAYHKISVELKNAPSGSRVVVKPGFYAPLPFAQKNPLERLLNAADAIVGGTESGAISMSVLAAPFHLDDGPTAYVPVVMEIDGASLLANQQGEVAPTEVYAYALDAAGGVRDFFSQTLGLDLQKVGPQLKASGLKFFGHLDLPPGDYSVRAMVRNGKTGAYSLRVVPVRVPAFTQAGGPYLLPPLFSEPPGRWLMIREAKRGTATGEPPYPFMIGDQPYIPTSRPVLGAGQDAQFSLVVYNLGAGDVQAAGKVLGADGKEVQAAELTLTDRERGGAAGPDRLTASFKAPQLLPGEYRLQVTLTGAGAPQTSTIAFLVAKPGARG